MCVILSTRNAVGPISRLYEHIEVAHNPVRINFCYVGMTCRTLKMQHEYAHCFRLRLLCRGLRCELGMRGTSILAVKDCHTKRTGTRYINCIHAGNSFPHYTAFFLYSSSHIIGSVETG